MSHAKCLLLCLSFALSACASAPSPEDAQMADAMCTQGKTLLAAGKTDQARDIYTSATHRDTTNARAWNGLGVADDLLGKREEATTAYGRAVDLAPQDLNMLNNLAHVSLEAGDYDNVIALLEPHIGDADATPVMRQNLAEAYAVKGMDLDAERLLCADLPPAQATARMSAYHKMSADHDSYADMGSYPTEGMAQAHIVEAKQIVGKEASAWNFTVVPDVKVAGGIPVFTIRITGESPSTICDIMNPQALPCVPHGK